MSIIYDNLTEINEKLLSSNCDIVECLKKARYVAKHYNDTATFSWIENELKGYEKSEDLPKYRVILALIYRTVVETHPVGWGQVVRRKFDDVYDSIEYGYYSSIETILDKSNEERNKLEFYLKKSGASIPIIIRGQDMKKIIMEVNLLLSDYIQDKLSSIKKIPLETPLMKIFNNFHLVAKNLEKRHENRKTIIISDEYDTQDLLNALLLMEFVIVKKEQYNPSFAGKDSRIDFFLRLENIGIEVKKIRDKAHAKNLINEIIDDKAKYSNNKDITELYFFIYDPTTYLLNREELILDLEKDTPKQFNKVKIIIKPEL